MTWWQYTVIGLAGVAGVIELLLLWLLIALAWAQFELWMGEWLGYGRYEEIRDAAIGLVCWQLLGILILLGWRWMYWQGLLPQAPVGVRLALLGFLLFGGCFSLWTAFRQPRR